MSNNEFAIAGYTSSEDDLLSGLPRTPFGSRSSTPKLLVEREEDRVAFASKFIAQPPLLGTNEGDFIDRNKAEFQKHKDLYKKATKILKDRLRNLNPERTAEEINAESWAEKFIKFFEENYKRNVMVNEEQAPKFPRVETQLRRRSLLEASEKKKSKYEGLKKPIINNVRIDLKLSIVDLGSIDWRISPENFSLIEQAIFDKIMDKVAEGSLMKPPHYDMTERFHGFMVITCDSKKSVDLLVDVVKCLPELWPGAKVMIRMLKDLPAPPKAKIFVPMKVVDEKRVLRGLAFFNEDINMSDWILLQICRYECGRTPLIFRIDEESTLKIRKRNNTLWFNIRKVPVYIYKPESLAVALSEKPEAINDEDVDIKGLEEYLDITSIVRTSLRANANPNNAIQPPPVIPMIEAKKARKPYTRKATKKI